MKNLTITLPSGIKAEYRDEGVMLIEQGRDADFELLDEPLTYKDLALLSSIKYD